MPPARLGLSNEVSLFFRDRGVAAALAAQAEEDRARSTPVTLAEALRPRPGARVRDQLAAAVLAAAGRVFGPRD